MSDVPEPQAPGDGLQIDQADVGTAPAERKGGSGAGRFVRALVVGGLAGVVGFLIYYGIAQLTGYEFSLIAILVGFMVGFAVRAGAHGRGGWLYQLMAMAITYLSIVMTYVPPLFEHIARTNDSAAVEHTEVTEADPEGVGGPGGVANPASHAVAASDETPSMEGMTPIDLAMGTGTFLLLVLALPFLAGFDNILGILFIAFGLWEAWRINKRTKYETTDPFQVGAVPSSWRS